MNKQETVKLFARIAMLFPRDTTFRNADAVMVESWEELLSDIPADLAMAAVKAHAATSPFVPGISDIRSRALSIAVPDTRLSGEDLWASLIKAVRRGRNRRTESMEAIPEYAREFADRWFIEVCDAEELGVIRGQFVRAWEAHNARKKDDAYMPPVVKNAAALIAGKTIRGLEAGR